MGVRFIAIILLVWLGLVVARRLGHPARAGNAFPRWMLNVVLLAVVLFVAGSLFVRFALRSGNAALMLVSVLLTLALAIALGWYATRATSAARRRHRGPPGE